MQAAGSRLGGQALATGMKGAFRGGRMGAARMALAEKGMAPMAKQLTQAGRAMSTAPGKALGAGAKNFGRGMLGGGAGTLGGTLGKGTTLGLGAYGAGSLAFGGGPKPPQPY